MQRLKHALKWLVSPLSVRIRGGPLVGDRWPAATGSRFLSGTYEPFKTQPFLDVLKPGDVVVDVGAHIGYYAALASKLVGPTGMVIAFEPRPLNLRFLRQHVRANRLDNVRIVDGGVGDRAVPAAFNTRTGTGTGHLAKDGDLVATHGDELHREVVELVDKLGYGHRVLDTGGRSGDTEILATPPGDAEPIRGASPEHPGHPEPL